MNKRDPSQQAPGWRQIAKYPHLLLVLLILANLLVAAFTFDDYGESWDESNIYLYAHDTQQAYAAGLRGAPLIDQNLGPYNLRYYGPAYFVFSDLFARGVGAVFPGVHPVDLWHLAYFISFLVAVVCVYALCLRWVGRPAAFAAALLFNLQPLIYGHAFINPKDIPLLAFFLLSIALGLRAVDAVKMPGPARWTRIALAAAVLGVATAMRVSAPLAGLIVAAELGWRGRGRALGMLAVYVALAAGVTLLLWPYLWGAPMAHFFSVLNEMRDFPMDIAVKFNGVIYSSMDLPLDYLPRLLLYQLTVPALLLVVGGAAVGVWRFVRRTLPEPRLLLLILAWSVLPVAAILLSRPTMYDNFRQFLFVLPPVFVLAALALDELFVRVRPSLAWALVALVAAPGLLAMLALHPFEYAYYNRLAGDPSNLQARFETDYWVTSYRQAIDYLDEIAPPNARIFIYGDGGPAEMLRHFGRPDLTVAPRGGIRSHDYAILTTRTDVSEDFFSWGPIIFQVERSGMVFVVVKQVR